MYINAHSQQPDARHPRRSRSQGSTDVGEEYVYTVDGTNDHPLTLKVVGNVLLYDGPLDDFDPDATEEKERELADLNLSTRGRTPCQQDHAYCAATPTTE